MSVWLIGILCFLAGAIAEFLRQWGRVEKEIEGLQRFKESLKAEYNRRGELAPFERNNSCRGKLQMR
jgi:hypothetical protein